MKPRRGSRQSAIAERESATVQFVRSLRPARPTGARPRSCGCGRTGGGCAVERPGPQGQCGCGPARLSALRQPHLAPYARVPYSPQRAAVLTRPSLGRITPIDETATCIPGPLTECLRRAIDAFNVRHPPIPFERRWTSREAALVDIEAAVCRAEMFAGTPSCGMDDTLLYEFFRPTPPGVCNHLAIDMNVFLLEKFAGDVFSFTRWLGGSTMTGTRDFWMIPTRDRSDIEPYPDPSEGPFLQPGMKPLLSCGSSPAVPVPRINPARVPLAWARGPAARSIVGRPAFINVLYGSVEVARRAARRALLEVIWTMRRGRLGGGARRTFDCWFGRTSLSESEVLDILEDTYADLGDAPIYEIDEANAVMYITDPGELRSLPERMAIGPASTFVDSEPAFIGLFPAWSLRELRVGVVLHEGFHYADMRFRGHEPTAPYNAFRFQGFVSDLARIPYDRAVLVRYVEGVADCAGGG